MTFTSILISFSRSVVIGDEQFGSRVVSIEVVNGPMRTGV